MSTIVEHITEEHLTEDMRLIANICGIEVVRKLMAELAGVRIYIPHPNRIESVVRAYIKERRREQVEPHVIAKELNMSVDYVRNACRSAVNRPRS